MDLYDFAPVGYFTFDKEGIIKEVNLTGARLLGVERRYLMRKPFAVYLACGCKDEFYSYMKKVFQGIKAGMCELKLVARDGVEHYVALEGVLRRNGEEPECHAAVSDMTELWQAREVMKTSLKEKETLLKEIHHRVKNNLQTVGSLLTLQQKQFTDPLLCSAFEKSRGRVNSIARIHETLCETGNFGRIDFGMYLKGLIASISTMNNRPEIACIAASESLFLPTEQAVPVALIINEVVTNAFKHAFPGGRGGTIAIKLSTAEKGMITLSISDDGEGLPEHFAHTKAESLGMQLVQCLAEQILGTIEIDSEKGTTFTVRFKR